MSHTKQQSNTTPRTMLLVMSLIVLAGGIGLYNTQERSEREVVTQRDMLQAEFGLREIERSEFSFPVPEAWVQLVDENVPYQISHPPEWIDQNFGFNTEFDGVSTRGEGLQVSSQVGVSVGVVKNQVATTLPQHMDYLDQELIELGFTLDPISIFIEEINGREWYVRITDSADGNQSIEYFSELNAELGFASISMLANNEVSIDTLRRVVGSVRL